MCDFRYPYYLNGLVVKYIGNVDTTPVLETGCYTVGHSGSITVYFDGKKEYAPGELLPDGMYWKHANWHEDL